MLGSMAASAAQVRRVVSLADEAEQELARLTAHWQRKWLNRLQWTGDADDTRLLDTLLHSYANGQEHLSAVPSCPQYSTQADIIS